MKRYKIVFCLSKNVSNSSVAHLRPELEPFPWRYYLTSNCFPAETGLDSTVLSRFTVPTVQTAQSTHTSNNWLDHSRTIKNSNVCMHSYCTWKGKIVTFEPFNRFWKFNLFFIYIPSLSTKSIHLSQKKKKKKKSLIPPAGPLWGGHSALCPPTVGQQVELI